MRTERLSLWSAVTALGLLASLTCEKQAVADDLKLGSTFNPGDYYTFNGSSPGRRRINRPFEPEWRCAALGLLHRHSG